MKTNEPIKIEVREDLDITPVNITNTAEIPIHLRSAAERELERNIKSDVIEKVDHATEWSSRGFFVKKQGKPEDPISVRLVTDFRPVNKILRRPGYPNEGSAQLIKRIPADARCFAVLDLTSGFFQCALPEAYRDLFAFVLPMGKFRYKRLPQGTSVSPDIFNLLTDGELRGIPWILKNMDDLLITASNFQELTERRVYVLQVCQRKNIKLSPKKFQAGECVTFGGTEIKYNPSLESVDLAPE